MPSPTQSCCSALKSLYDGVRQLALLLTGITASFSVLLWGPPGTSVFMMKRTWFLVQRIIVWNCMTLKLYLMYCRLGIIVLLYPSVQWNPSLEPCTFRPLSGLYLEVPEVASSSDQPTVHRMKSWELVAATSVWRYRSSLSSRRTMGAEWSGQQVPLFDR